MRTAGSLLLIVLASGIVGLAAQQTPKLPTPPRPSLPPPVATPQAAPVPAVPAVPQPLALQIMLDRIGLSPGEIDGKPGINLQRAIEAFQRGNDLNATGKADDATLERLTTRAGAQPPLVTYEITEADVAGPFTPDIPADIAKQADLSALGYRDAVEALGERFHTNPALLRTLNPMATFGRGERIQVPNVAAPDPLAPAPGTRPVATIVVSKKTSTLTLRDADGRTLFQAPVTTGSTHDPLPLGTWKVTGVQQSPEFHYNPALFWDADPSHSKATIPPGPNNPVGVVWIGLNKEHYGIHGTPEPSRIGHVTSHGCVRLTNWDAQRVAMLARPGTTVIFE